MITIEWKKRGEKREAKEGEENECQLNKKYIKYVMKKNCPILKEKNL